MTQLALLDLPSNARDPDLRVLLEWPPSLNHSYWINVFPPATTEIRQAQARLGWSGDFYRWLQKNIKRRRKPDEKAKTYREMVAWILKARRVRFGDDDVAAWLIFHPPTRTKPDMDNRKKHIFDAAELAGLVENDNQFADYRVTRGEPVKGGSVEVMMWRL